MDATAFLADIERAPRTMQELIPHLGQAWSGIDRESSIVLVGMGSSHYANSVAAARLRAAGVAASAVLASSDLRPSVSARDVVIVVSAGGSSPETVDAAQHYAGRCRMILLTNADAGPITSLADDVIPLMAGPEPGGVACRSFQHTLIRLLELEQVLRGEQGLVGTVERAIESTSDLLDRRGQWLAPALELLAGPDVTAFVAPVSRLSSAQQGALMLREGPRRMAVGCETGDWSHVDVYLTKTMDYRMLLFAGSRWEPELLRWCRERGSTVVALGEDVPGAALSLRYRHDEAPGVRLLAETIVPELLAQALWV